LCEKYLLLRNESVKKLDLQNPLATADA